MDFSKITSLTNNHNYLAAWFRNFILNISSTLRNSLCKSTPKSIAQMLANGVLAGKHGTEVKLWLSVTTQGWTISNRSNRPWEEE